MGHIPCWVKLKQWQVIVQVNTEFMHFNIQNSDMTLDVKRYVRLTHKRRSVPKTEACLNCNLKMLTLINDKHSQILLIFFLNYS